MLETLANLAAAFPTLLAPHNALALCAGVVGGVIIGALPGLTPTMGVAVLVPFTFGMPAETGLILLGGLYCASVFAGAITAILVNIPGAPANVATLFDGHPMALAGRAREAIYYATTASMIGGLFGMAIFLFFSPPLARLSLMFGPAEVFWVAVFGLTIIASLSVGSMLKGLVSGVLGLLLSQVGMDPVTGMTRFTLDSQTLLAGIPIVAGLIGVFALSQLFGGFEERFRGSERGESVEAESGSGTLRRIILDTLRRRRALLVGSVVGTVVGIIPGAGGQVAALTAYNEAKRWAPEEEKELYGKGNPDGIVAAESANNAMCGGSLVPLFTLGIPGSPTAAVLLGGLLIHGLYPGHRLYTEHAGTINVFILAMFLAQVVMFLVGVGVVTQMTRLLRTPRRYLAPGILILCVIGAFATQNSLGDVWIMAVLGLLMYVGVKAGLSPAAVVLGHILGGIAENGLLLGARIAQAGDGLTAYFFARPICVALIVLTLGSILLAALFERRSRKRAARGEGFVRPALLAWSEGGLTMRQTDLILAILLLGGGVAVCAVSNGFDGEAGLFPFALGTTLAGLAILLGIGALFGEGGAAEAARPWAGFPLAGMLAAIVCFCVYVALIGVLGFYVSTCLFMLCMSCIVAGEAPKGGALARPAGVAALFCLALHAVFALLLKVPAPKGVLF